MNDDRYKFGFSLPCLLVWLIVFLPGPLAARTEKPSLVAEEFYRLLRLRQYDEATELLTTADRGNIAALRKKAAQAAESGKTTQPLPDAAAILTDLFFLMHGTENQKMLKKAQDGETIMPERIGFFVPGQYYVVGNYAVVFTRETYEISPDNTGPVRDDPRKLWIDPTNALSKVRDEAYFKQWWVWEGDRLVMPGILWLVKEKRDWRIDLLSGVVPREAFRKILRWHFGRDVFEEKPKTPAEAPAPPAK